MTDEVVALVSSVKCADPDCATTTQGDEWRAGGQRWAMSRQLEPFFRAVGAASAALTEHGRTGMEQEHGWFFRAYETP